MSMLKKLGAASAAILKTIMGPQVGKNDICDAIGYVTNAGAPSSVVPDFIGQHLFDTTNSTWYKAYGVTSGQWNLSGVPSGLSAAELSRVADVSTRVVDCTAATLVVTEADHDGRTIVLDRPAGIAVTLPVASAGLRFRFVVKTDFTGAATIKSVSGADIMIGHALMGNNTDNAVVDWQSVAASTNDTIDMFGTANSTGGLAGQVVTIEGLAANRWLVEIRGDAAGTEATPFANTVA
jgi:hypothetical protein